MFFKGNRVKTPTVLQMEMLECGAASLGIILGYFGKFVSLEELRFSCGVSRNGSNALNIIKAAGNYGLQADGYRVKNSKTLRDILKTKVPFIAFWEQNHFLVVEGMKGNRVFINDPAFGSRTILFDDFIKSFSNVYIAFKTTDEFKKSPGKRLAFLQIKDKIRGSGGKIILAFLISLSLTLPGLCLPGLTKVFIDQYLLKQNDFIFHIIILGLIIFTISSVILKWLQRTLLIKLEIKLLLNSCYNFMNSMFKLPLSFFVQRSTGDLISRLRGNEIVVQQLSEGLAISMFNTVQILILGAAMFFYCWQLAILVCINVLINIVNYFFTRRTKADLNFNTQQVRARLTDTIISGIQSIDTIFASGLENSFYKKWSGHLVNYINAYQKLNLVNLISSEIPAFVNKLTNVLVIGAGALIIIRGDLSLGGLIAFQMLAVQFTKPINKLVTFGNQYQKISVELQRISDVEAHKPDIKFKRKASYDESGNMMSKLSGSLELNNITFGYSRLELPVIKDFSLKLTPGKKVAIVGGPGSGKSTVGRLITGQYKAWSGEIIADGKPIDSYHPVVLAASLSFVTNDLFFFNGTVKENLTMWNGQISENELIEATKTAMIYDDIISRSGAFYSEIKENGSNFSGGQLQRMEIARSLLNSPSILILDEATSALDSKLERIIYQNLDNCAVSMIIIANRLSAIEKCDEIIVIDNGIVVESGTHEVLMKKQGRYFELICPEMKAARQ